MGIAFAATAALPPGPYSAVASSIVDGLPLGASIEITAWLRPDGSSEATGGSFGGDVQTWNPTVLDLEMVGTGALAGVSVVTHSGPRTAATSPQIFEADVFTMQGQLPPAIRTSTCSASRLARTSAWPRRGTRRSRASPFGGAAVAEAAAAKQRYEPVADESGAPRSFLPSSYSAVLVCR